MKWPQTGGNDVLILLDIKCTDQFGKYHISFKS